ncbi:hypothetical protein GGR58DRAFT_520741 [Xylaria digitata]|nr:hypothetical protein GGR58DRAFT_520741 [Xylaria digitata]
MTRSCGTCMRLAELEIPTDQSLEQQRPQSNEIIRCGGPPDSSRDWWERGYMPPHPQLSRRGGIIKIGEGTIVAGQSTEGFVNKSRISLCYQCCKHISLDALLKTREESCGEHSCCRTKEAGIPFKEMPSYAAEACEDFQTFLVWWMDKVDHGVDESIERRAKERVQEMREEIPVYNPSSMADLLKIL